MDVVYHGSNMHGLESLEPRKSTHGRYVYATPSKVLAVLFSGRCGDDLTYSLGHFDFDRNGPWELVENIPGAFEKMFSNSSSIYTLDASNFRDLNSGFREVVSEEKVDVLDEEQYDSVYEAVFKLEEEGLLKIYRYPDKPQSLKQDGSVILDKFRKYKNELNIDIGKRDFERLVYLHPSLLPQINDLATELGFKFQFKKTDILRIFKERVRTQLRNPDREQYIDSSYQAICEYDPEYGEIIEPLYTHYKIRMERKQKSNGFRI